VTPGISNRLHKIILAVTHSTSRNFILIGI
jgi:hypothetical protein